MLARQNSHSEKLDEITASGGMHIINSNTNHNSSFGQLGKLIFQSLPIGIVIFDPRLKIIEANPQAAKLIQLGDYIDKSLAKGKTIDSKVCLDWTQQLKSVISTGQSHKFDDINYTLNGETKLLKIYCSGFPQGGVPPYQQTKTQRNFGGILIIEDITEKANNRRQLASIERLATIGKLTSKVTHELNNLMDGILRYINLAIRINEQKNLEKPKQYLAQCRQGLMRMVQIVSELLEFSRSTYASSEGYVHIEQLIEEAIKLMGSRAEALNVQILRNYAPHIPQIRGGNLFSVFCNLIKNALDAMPDGGKLIISTCLAADNTAVIEFRDTGAGFSPQHADAIFEPFFTTKDKDKGTGLGLAICKDIVERYGGRITAQNAPGGGSIFAVYLPVARVKTSPSPNEKFIKADEK